MWASTRSRDASRPTVEKPVATPNDLRVEPWLGSTSRIDPDFAIREFREMKTQPSLERALRHREILKA